MSSARERYISWWGGGIERAPNGWGLVSTIGLPACDKSEAGRSVPKLAAFPLFRTTRWQNTSIIPIDKSRQEKKNPYLATSKPECIFYSACINYKLARLAVFVLPPWGSVWLVAEQHSSAFRAQANNYQETVIIRFSSRPRSHVRICPFECI